jgi:predicted TIM-barrel fold metal-dependent hydrolase
MTAEARGSIMTIDVNVHLFRWPFRRLRGDDTADLVAALRRHQVVQAWAGSFEALLHRDVAGVNDRLAHECRKHRELIPFGTVNPLLPDWQEDLRRCRQVHRMPGVRLYPNYHGYRLDHPDFAALLRGAAEQELIVQIVVKMEDERTQHPLVRVPAVDLAPLAGHLRDVKGVRVVLLNALASAAGAEALRKLAGAGQVYVDIAMLEGVGGVAAAARTLPAERVLFGSHYPLFYHEAAQLKLREAALPADQERALRSGNARRLLP